MSSWLDLDAPTTVALPSIEAVSFRREDYDFLTAEGKAAFQDMCQDVMTVARANELSQAQVNGFVNLVFKIGAFDLAQPVVPEFFAKR